MPVFLDSWVSTFVSMDVSFWEKTARTIAVYLGIVLLLRFVGRRLLAEMNNLDLVVILLLSNVVQNSIIGPDGSVLGGLVGASVLILVNLGLDRWSERNAGVRWLLEGTPTRLIHDGVVDEAALRRHGLTSEELILALGRLGADDPSEVETATLEPAGDVLITLRRAERAATQGELAAAVAELKAYLDARLGSSTEGA